MNCSDESDLLIESVIPVHKTGLFRLKNVESGLQHHFQQNYSQWQFSFGTQFFIQMIMKAVQVLLRRI